VTMSECMLLTTGLHFRIYAFYYRPPTVMLYTVLLIRLRWLTKRKKNTWPLKIMTLYIQQRVTYWYICTKEA